MSQRKNINFIFISVFESAEYNVFRITAGAYEIQSLNAEIDRIIIKQGHITEENYLFKIRPRIPTLGSVLEKEPGRRWLVSFAQDDTLRDLLGSKPKVLHDEYIISDYPADILPSDNNRSKQISPNV